MIRKRILFVCGVFYPEPVVSARLLDSASLAEYSDTLEIAGLADITCFVCCTGITPKSIIAKLSDEFLPAPCLILKGRKS